MKFKDREAKAAESDMTPMIDMVFQLIAFFMVISNFEQTQADERVKLPENYLAQPPETKRDKELVINVGYHRDSEGELTGEGTPLWFHQGTGKGYPIENFKLPMQLETQNFVDTGVNPQDVTVIIRADADVPTGVVQDLIKLAQESKYEKFALSAEQKRAP